MSYKALYDMLCSVKRHMNARVIFRWVYGTLFNKEMEPEEDFFLKNHPAEIIPGQLGLKGEPLRWNLQSVGQKQFKRDETLCPGPKWLVGVFSFIERSKLWNFDSRRPRWFYSN